MRFPRFILNPSVGVWIRLWQHERKETARLRRELKKVEMERDEWRDKLLAKVNITPLFTPPPPPVEPVVMPPIGIMQKRQYLEAKRGESHTPTAEEILSAASRANGQ